MRGGPDNRKAQRWQIKNLSVGRRRRTLLGMSNEMNGPFAPQMLQVGAKSLRKMTTENLCCYRCFSAATTVAAYDGLDVGLCERHVDDAPVFEVGSLKVLQ
jgi:hypothetical protein